MAMALPAQAREPVSTAFTYQGELAAAGVPATGTFDIRFRLFDAASDGIQIGSTLCSDDLVIENGRFAVALDFGAAFTGEKRFLEIEVRQDAGQGCSDATGYATLTPRQEMTATPNASFAQSAASLNGQSPSFYQNAANLTGTLPSSRLSGTYTGPLSLTNASNVFVGNGAAITNLNAANISSGTFNAARMPTNWAAGGDLTGFFPSPTIGTGAVTLSKLSPSVQGMLSQAAPLVTQPASVAPADAVAWGASSFDGRLNVPALPAGVTFVAATTGADFSAALRSDGAIVAWGASGFNRTNVPALPPGVRYTAVTAGEGHTVGLRSDGTVAVWGDNSFGQLNVPVLNPGSTFSSVSAGSRHTMAIRNDDTVFGWGSNDYGQANQPPTPPAGKRYTAVAAGAFHNLALRNDGVVVAWGANFLTELLSVPALPSGLVYTAVSIGEQHGLALRSDGVVIAWGQNSYGQLNVPALPAGVTYTKVAATKWSSLALRSDGVVVAWGNNAVLDVPALNPESAYTAVASGCTSFHAIAIRGTRLPASLTSTLGLSIGSTTPPPAAGGISVAGASSFSGAVSATSFVGSGAGLTNLNASSIIGTLVPAQIPNLDAAKITSGVLAVPQIPNLDASKIVSGTLAAAQIPNLDATTITSGTLAAAQIPNLDASKISSGTLAAAQIPNLDAAKIATGTLSNARTSGTNLNSPSTLVLRDASGNFAAGTISAALNGNAASATTAVNATTATTATNANQLGGQPASFYTNASNLTSGTLADGLLSGNIPR
ncbi:MAG: hypothetical protein NTV94_07860, partial [Planctomycetota bacterium]|nr:hypothetical protein [Planctomycetota bacterium]